MTSVSQKIKFKKKSTNFYSDLSGLTNTILTPEVIKRADTIGKLKFAIYSGLFLTAYFLLFFIKGNGMILCVNYTAIGFIGILLAFNGGHDSVHNTFSKNKKLDALIFYLVFNLQGVNARLWRKRHIASHHIFPNVDGCDADIDDNPFLRLSKAHKLKRVHKYQHLYAPVIYCLYTLHWIFIKDFAYLNKKQLANLKNFNFSKLFVLELVFLKVGYITYMVIIPLAFTNFAISDILLAFLVMHFTISIFLVLTLVISHLCQETVFPTVDSNGILPYDYYEHQLAVSLDFHPTSTFANWIFGGFNSHSAHHLFPKLPPTLYTKITPAIKAMALAHNLPYNETGIPQAIYSHLRYLKALGNPEQLKPSNL